MAMHSSSAQLEFSIGMIIGMMSFSLTRPYSPQGSIFVFAHHHVHVLG